MRLRIALFVVALVALRGAGAQSPLGAEPQGNANLQNLLAALAAGAEVVMVTPLANGMLELTRFRPPLALPRPQAEAAVAIAREQLRLLDIPNPTADQLARALAGGTIELRDGPQRLPGVLPSTGQPATVTSEIVLAASPPQIATGAASAAAGGSASLNPLPETPRR